MKIKIIWAKILAIGGEILTGLPILFPLAVSFPTLFRSGRVNFDYLFPAEMFPIVLLGGIMLLVSTILVRTHIKWIAWTFGAVVLTLAALMIVPIVTGLDNSIEQPAGNLMLILQGIVALHWLAIIALVIGGIILIVALFKKK